MAESYDYSALKKKRDQIAKSLQQSNTAYSGNVKATTTDKAREAQLRKVQDQITAARDQRIKDRWLSQADNADSGPAPVGLVGGVVNTLLAPQRGIVGAVESLAGKNPTSGFWENIGENIKSGHRGFGDMMKRSGMNGPLASALGLAADIVTDPVNWATMGTAALIPRMGVGLAKGGIKGAVKGAASRGLQIANSASKPLKGIARAGNYVKERGALAFNKEGAIAKLVDTGMAPQVIKPGVTSHKIAKEVSKVKTTDMFKNLQTKAFESSLDYNSAIGKDVQQLASQSWYRDHVRNTFEKAVDSSPLGTKIFEAFELSNPKWIRTSKMKDALLRELQLDDEIAATLYKKVAAGEDIDDELAKQIAVQLKKKIEKAPKKDLPFALDYDPTNVDDIVRSREKAHALRSIVGDDIADKTMSLADELEDVATIANDPDKVMVLDELERAIRMVDNQFNVKMTRDDLAKIMKSGIVDETGIKWYDNKIAQARAYKKTVDKFGKKITIDGAKILDVYQGFVNLFRVAKVGASPTAFTNSVVGNLVMAHMSGITPGPAFMHYVGNAWKAMHKSRASDLVLSQVLSNPELIQYMRRYPGHFTRVAGSSPVQLGIKHQLDLAISKGKEAGVLPKSMTNEEAIRVLAEGLDDAIPDSPAMQALQNTPAKSFMDGGPGNPATFVDEGKSAAELLQKGEKVKAPGNYLDTFLKDRKAGSAGDYDMPMGMIPQEFYSSDWANKLFRRAAEAGEGPNATIGGKFANFLLNKMPNEYEKIDQSYRLGTINYLMDYGLDEAGLNVFKRFVKLNPEDISAAKNVDGVARYTLSADKATEAAASIYLNYAAMPAAVKFMRSVPLLGQPFASFMYGMTLKTGQTIAYNPAALNKTILAINNLSGTKTPLEKDALETPYYERNKKYGMYRIPFFDQNKVYYANLNALIPWMTLNTFNPSSRGLDNDTLPEGLVSAIDRSPFLKDPVAQVMLDTLIIPMILRDSTPPGAFGQAVFPEDASLGEKAFYTGRALAEPFTPGILGLGGFAYPDIPLGEEMSTVDLLPMMKGREAAYAKSGKNIYGRTGKEPAASRAIRAFLKQFGANVGAPIDTSYIDEEVKSQIGNVKEL